MSEPRKELSDIERELLVLRTEIEESIKSFMNRFNSLKRRILKLYEQIDEKLDK